MIIHNQTQAKTHWKWTNQDKDQDLHRPRQQQINSHCAQSTSSVTVTPYFDNVEEDIYSQGESYPEKIYDKIPDPEGDLQFEEDCNGLEWI